MADRILVVDDEPRIVRLVSAVLKAVGYEVIAATSGEEAIEKLALEQPHLVLLDILLEPGMDGYEVCRRIRSFSSVPIVMLTAKAQEEDLLRGFEVGADDYVTKPFSAKELVARVRAVLRRAHRPEDALTTVVTCGDLQIDFARRCVTVRGQRVSLTRTEYAVLHHLAIHRNKVVLHQELLTAVWGPEYRDDLEYLRAYIRHLRRKIEDDPSSPRYLINYPGVGYMLACPEA
ncbi:MAG: response regulator transcription factor [Anaerolineae bacterium]|nr:response regulator transcription factor [Anaerolineae bacterium]